MRTFSALRNPKWINPSQTMIQVDVNFNDVVAEWSSVSIEDPDTIQETYLLEIYTAVMNGDAGEIAPFEIPTLPDDEDHLAHLRQIRDNLLQMDVDPIVSNPLRWAEMKETKRQEWLEYRQLLLNLPSDFATAKFEYNVEQEGWQWKNVTFPARPMD